MDALDAQLKFQDMLLGASIHVHMQLLSDSGQPEAPPENRLQRGALSGYDLA